LQLVGFGAMVIISVPKSVVISTGNAQDIRRSGNPQDIRRSGNAQDIRRPSIVLSASASVSYETLEFKFTDTSMQTQMAGILSLACVGSGANAFERYALALKDKLYIDYRSPSKDFNVWNDFQELELIRHPHVEAEVLGSAMRKLHLEVKSAKQEALSRGDSAEKTSTSIADVVKRSISIFQDLKRTNRPSHVFLWDHLVSKYGCLEVLMDILTSLHPGSSLHREILHTLCNCVQCKAGRNLFLADDAHHVTGIVELLQSKSIATIKVALHIVASLLRAKTAYGIIKKCIKEMCRRTNVPQWSILVALLAESDVDVRYSALSLIIALGRSTGFAAADKLASKVASTKFFMKLELAGILKGLSFLAASSITEELQLVDQYTKLSQGSPIPRSWRDCEILKQQISILEERCLNLEEQVCVTVMSFKTCLSLFFRSFLRAKVRARLLCACKRN
jgi:hypothetical protein